MYGCEQKGSLARPVRSRRAGCSYRKHIRLYIKALRSGKNEILGVVLNGLSPRRIEYYSNYRYYRSYKKYYGAQG